MEIKGRVVAVYFEKDNVFLKVELDDEYKFTKESIQNDGTLSLNTKEIFS